MDLQLKEKRIFVAGASRGLGFAIARGFVEEGAYVAINSRDSENIQRAANGLSEEYQTKVVPIQGDVSDPSTPDRLIQKTIDSLGGLDILITNSGGPPSGKFESFDDEDWLAAVNLVFLSHVRLIRAALPFLRQSTIASVLTVTSYSLKQPIPQLVLSNSIRAATVGLTKSLALELGADGIRFNSILPSWTKTERVIELLSNRAKLNETTVDEEFVKQSQDSPFGRMAEPEEFANAAVFLASPAASYITGTMLTVDGGMYKATF